MPKIKLKFEKKEWKPLQIACDILGVAIPEKPVAFGSEMYVVLSARSTETLFGLGRLLEKVITNPPAPKDDKEGGVE